MQHMRNFKHATLKDVGEVFLVKTLQRMLRTSSKHVSLGVGDDAAVLACDQGHVVVSCDMLVEGEDFDWGYMSWKQVGIKAASVNLSDMAAMGATPRGLCVSVAVPSHARVRDVLGMLRALHQQGMKYGAPLIGGDFSGTKGPVVLSVTAMGACKHAVLKRHAASVGDVVMLGGPLGLSACGMEVLQKRIPAFRGSSVLVKHHTTPQPQVALGLFLSRLKGVTSCVDVSDGLAKDVLLLPREGGVQIEPSALPVPLAVEKACALRGVHVIDRALTGGEDFVLACTVDASRVSYVHKKALREGLFLRPVGKVVSEKGLWLQGWPEPYKGKGFEHF
jgi:thiamine-monophosphate kinase